MKALRSLTATAMLPLLIAAGCGGGGGEGGGETVTPPPQDGGGTSVQVNTYGDTNLPGRLLITARTGQASVYDLRTGQRTAAPASALGGNNWNGSTNPKTMVRVSIGGPGGKEVLERLNTSDWSAIGASTLLGGNYRSPRVSPDGRYILAFWNPGEDLEDKLLTIFDAETGNIVKRGSELDGETVISIPAAWLPDGRYVYLVGRTLRVSSPTSTTSTVVATLPLPDNSVFQDGNYQSGFSKLTVSPDGQKIAFDWDVNRGTTADWHIFVANIDGTGLHRLTAVPDPTNPIQFVYGSMSWSPDSRHIAAAVYMNDSVVAPIFPPDQSFPGVPGGIIGSVGCGTNQVFVLPVEANQVAIPWPAFDTKYGIKVRDASGTGGKWLTACGSMHWIE
jgi:Tol biopolymer transport system component